MGSALNRFVPANLALLARQLFTKLVQLFVFLFVTRHELFVPLAGIPEIESEVNRGTKGITQQPSLAVVRVDPEEPGPSTTRAIGFLEYFFTTRLDIVLPEGYKHKAHTSPSSPL